MQTANTIDQLPTPALLLEREKLRANIRRMSTHIGDLGCTLRPHVKTNKSIDVVKEIIAGGNTQGITVSTLGEADYFFENGIDDITYAVGIAPNKLAHVAELIEAGCKLKIILDSLEAARIVVDDAERRDVRYEVLIELDVDGHRSGMDPEGAELLEVGRLLEMAPGTRLTGVLTHAGESYDCATPEALLEIARQERDLSVLAAERLRQAGCSCPVVSIGSTPTALSIDDLSGVTEVRAGVYVFFDLVMAGIGVCEPDDVAVSVLASVIGHQKDKGWVITDGGWMAMSRDRGTSTQAVDQGYGLVLDREGRSIPDLIVSGANQEHGIVSQREAGDLPPWGELPIGGLVRVLPNHACSTAAQHDHYVVIDGDSVVASWPIVRGW